MALANRQDEKSSLKGLFIREVTGLRRETPRGKHSNASHSRQLQLLQV